MKNFAIACALLTLLAATASAGELAVSNSTLDNMGLTSMQPMSDSDGMAIRGKGVFASVWGGSEANYGDSFATNNYEAGSQWHGDVGAVAHGKSLSFAADIAVEFWADPTGFTLGVAAIGSVAGGSASASAY